MYLNHPDSQPNKQNYVKIQKNPFLEILRWREGGREGKGKRHFLSIKKQKNIWIFNQALKIVSKENEQKQKNLYRKIFCHINLNEF